MGLFIVVESDIKVNQQINEAISSLDKQAVIKNYLDLKELYADLATNKIKDDISLAIIEFSNKKITEWPVEIFEFFKKFANDEFPGLNSDFKILFSSFDDEKLNHRTLLLMPAYNFVFKPLDELILKETINAALNFKSKLAPIELKSTKSSSSIGILKVVELFSVSELGFTTYSDVQLVEGSVSKYFCTIFNHERKRSAWAQCLRSFAHPKKANCFVNQFQFYGVDTAFLMTVRKFIVQQKNQKTSEFALDLTADEATLKIKIGLLAMDLETAAKLQEDLLHHFKNAEVEIIHFSKAEDLADKTVLQTCDTVLNLSEILPEEFIKLTKPNAKLFWLNSKMENEELRKELALVYKDLQYLPLDRSYLYKKLKIHHPELLEKEVSTFLTVTTSEKMKSANLIKISEISEIFVNFNYARELPPKANREFIFISEDETNLVELPAFCHFSEPMKSEKGVFFHQFVFFGMTDHFLKQIRLWITQDYILKNKKDK
ncbi:MAG: hypothetical protein WA160_12880 [Pseudobdellovibrio sp.]